MAHPPPTRIESLDYIRGFAILGILAVNAMSFNMPMDVAGNPSLSPVPLTPVDSGLWWVIHTFFEAKFYMLFSMLFGISLFLVSEKDEPPIPLLKNRLFRRLSWLVVFGLIHGALIWWGDILLMYAVTGFVFWKWRTLDGRRLLVWGSVFYLIGSTILAGLGLLMAYVSPDILASDRLSIAEEAALMGGTFMQSLHGNFSVWADGEISTLILYMPKIMGLMMLGLGLFKTGFFSGKWPTLPFVTLGVMALGLIGAQNLTTLREGFPWPHHYGLYRLANEFLAVLVSLAYAALLMRLAQGGWGQRLTNLLQPVGRMAFTHYLTQSLIMTALFYGGRGAGLYGTFSYTQLVPVVIIIWLLQIAFSHLWLRRFRYGPFEWLWRSLSAGRIVPIRL